MSVFMRVSKKSFSSAFHTRLGSLNGFTEPFDELIFLSFFASVHCLSIVSQSFTILY